VSDPESSATEAPDWATAPATAAELILDNIHDAVIATDLDNRVTYWTASAERMFGYTPEEALGRSFGELLPFEMTPNTSEQDLISTTTAGRTWRGEGTVRLPSGRELWLESTVSPIIVDDEIAGIVSVSRDMSTAHEAQRALGEQLQMLASLNEFGRVASSILQSDPLWTAIIDSIDAVIPADVAILCTRDRPTGRYLIRRANGVAQEVVGKEIVSGDGATGRAIASGGMVVEEDLTRAKYPPSVRDLVTPDHLSAVAIPFVREGAVLGALMVGRAEQHAMFSELERDALILLGSQVALALANADLLEEMSELAVHDGLTGLFNRRHFDAGVDLILARWRRDREKPLAAIMFDLDHFGRFNEEHGHQAGDAVLRAFSAILLERFRSSDLVARYGGEEFVVIMEGSSLADAARVADEVRRQLEGRTIYGPDGQPLQACVSAGCAALDPQNPTKEDLLRRADEALFMAKRAGRNRVMAPGNTGGAGGLG
jgi:diguanylate cyclase (GGDEF)-like protein/PAS domain S-box-containing protein